MKPIILSEKHENKFNLIKEPKDFRKPGYRHIRTHTRKPVNDLIELTSYEGKTAISCTMNFKVWQLLNLKETICENDIKSVFIFITPDGKEPDDDFWCYIFEKSVNSLIEHYRQKTKGTYLENEKLSIPDNIREDCMKQRKINKQSLSN
jgi:hypothetical protein